MFYFWLGHEAECIEPYCDGDFTDEEHIEADGFITVHCSGPIRPFPGWEVTWGDEPVWPRKFTTHHPHGG